MPFLPLLPPPKKKIGRLTLRLDSLSACVLGVKLLYNLGGSLLSGNLLGGSSVLASLAVTLALLLASSALLATLAAPGSNYLRSLNLGSSLLVTAAANHSYSSYNNDKGEKLLHDRNV